MKKLILSAAAVLTGLFAWAGVAAADTQDFTIPSFEADYYLSRSADGQSHLRVVEKIVAEFPQTDQNHGILRALPESYLNHSTHLQVNSVENGAGGRWNYTTSESNGNRVLKIGDADKYVHGRQTYVINYNEDYVTTKPGGYDGFFWDVNGDQWSQMFGVVTARVHFEGDLASNLAVDHNRCFTGMQGSTERTCSVVAEGGVVIATTMRELSSGETLTVEVGFAEGTFAAYVKPMSEWWELLGQLLMLIVPVLLALVYAGRKWWKYGRDPEGRGAIIAEYIPPKDLSVLGSSALLNEKFVPKALSAQIVDLAVRHYVKIYELDTKTLGVFKKTEYELELVRSLEELRAEESAAAALLFGAAPAVGARVNLNDLANKLYTQATALGKTVDKQLAVDGFFQAEPGKAKAPLMIAGVVILIAGGILLAISSWLGAGSVVAAMVLIVFGQFMPARTAKGVERREYLLGLKYYMNAAEAERLRILQSPHGELAEKIDAGDKGQLVKLYERLLPYAVIFGIEKGWAREMAPLYQQPPDWYSGSGTFNAVYFASAMSGLSAASTASFSAPSSSGGGGFAGGGGGGGGGGGW